MKYKGHYYEVRSVTYDVNEFNAVVSCKGRLYDDNGRTVCIPQDECEHIRRFEEDSPLFEIFRHYHLAKKKFWFNNLPTKDDDGNDVYKHGEVK